MFISEKITYKTKISSIEIIDILKKSPQYTTFGEGFGSNYFNVRQVVANRYLLTPLIRGVISEEHGNTIVKVSMKPFKFVSVFILIWVSVVLLACLFLLKESTTNGFNDPLIIIIPFVMIFFGLMIFYGIFKFESSNRKKDLQRILEAEIAR